MGVESLPCIDKDVESLMENYKEGMYAMETRTKNPYYLVRTKSCRVRVQNLYSSNSSRFLISEVISY